MTVHEAHQPRLDARNTAAFDLAIEMLSIALRFEDERADHGRAELLRARLSTPPAPDGLRSRVSALGSNRNQG